MDTLLIKHIHVTCAAISFMLFFLRGIWLLRGSVLLQLRPLKIAPHVVDTALLTSAIVLAWQLGYTPFNSSWLAAKIIALLVYIGLGMLAFRFAHTTAQRLTAWLAALLVFTYIVGAAVTRDPLLSL